MSIEQEMAGAAREYGAGHPDRAEALCRQVLAEQANHADALNLLGLALVGQNRIGEATEAFGGAVSARPGECSFHINFGLALAMNGQIDPAVAALRKSLELWPDNAEATYNLGKILLDAGRLDEAMAPLRRAVELMPQAGLAHHNLALGLRQLGQLDEALGSARRAFALTADNADILGNLAGTLCDLGRAGKSLDFYLRASAMRPSDASLHSNLLFTMLLDEGQDAQAILAEHRRWNALHAAGKSGAVRRHHNDRSPDRRLRIGYVSADFRRHVVGWNLAPLLMNHDHGQFEIVCYSGVRQRDHLTERFAASADGWRDIVGAPDEQVAEMVRADRIDILVDLSLHTAGNRLMVFARKAAPVQVTFVGYPGTTGVSTIDYRLTDPYLDPPGEHDADYSEQSVRLPHSFWRFDPSADPMPAEVAANALPASTAGFVTFGCLNNFCKVSDGSLALWAKVMNAVPGSRLLVMAPLGSGQTRVLDRLGADGVEAGRIEFVPRRDRLPYLYSYHRIDIGLDSFPYNGHSTSLDAFWMGVPIVTRTGGTVVSRAGLSQLSNLGLAELAADSDGRFVEIAARLAGDWARLSELRGGLRRRMERSPLMDSKGFVRGVEDAYRGMWRRWCEQTHS
jgi:protein O-GlcNAc transferase